MKELLLWVAYMPWHLSMWRLFKLDYYLMFEKGCFKYLVHQPGAGFGIRYGILQMKR